MNVQQSAKRRARNQLRYRVSHEPDYDHEAWQSDTLPTLQTHPDAFYLHRELVNPRPAKSTMRKAPHERLSIGALKKRLYRAGFPGLRGAKIAREIHAGPGLDALTVGGVVVMGWPVKELERRYGRRIALAVTRFVRAKLVMLDEYWSLFESSAMTDFVPSRFMRMRKYNSATIRADQTIDQLAGVA